MSIRAWGFIELNEITYLEKEAFSFEVVAAASNNKIGIKLGHNIPPEFQEEIKNRPDILPFELVDNPMTNVAEVLLIGDGIHVSEIGTRMDSGEELDSRINRIQQFLDRILEFDTVRRIILHTDSGFNEEQTIYIRISDFKKIVIDLYKQAENWTPTKKFVISR